MNDYYEFNMPEHKKPQQSTDTETVRRFIKDKYIKKLWVNDEEDDPVYLYQSGEFEKRRKKKEKKEKKKKEKKEKKKQEQKTKDKPAKATDEPNLIDFTGGDDFGDFQDGDHAQSESNAKSSNDFGDLIGGSKNDDFGDFVTPENKDDGFGDFIDPGANQMHHSNSCNSVPHATSNQSSSNGHKDLLNNLGNLYNQNTNTQSQNDPNNKYAALENMGNSFPQQQPQNMFLGMNMGGNSWHQPQSQNNAPFSSEFPNLTHQHSFPGYSSGVSDNSSGFAPQAFPTQQQHFHNFGHLHHASSNPPQSNYNFNYNTGSSGFNLSNQAQASSTSGTNNSDMFGLKATLMQKSKHTNMSGAPKQKQDTSAFSGLMSTQWH